MPRSRLREARSESGRNVWVALVIGVLVVQVYLFVAHLSQPGCDSSIVTPLREQAARDQQRPVRETSLPTQDKADPPSTTPTIPGTPRTPAPTPPPPVAKPQKDGIAGKRTTFHKVLDMKLNGGKTPILAFRYDHVTIVQSGKVKIHGNKGVQTRRTCSQDNLLRVPPDLVKHPVNTWTPLLIGNHAQHTDALYDESKCTRTFEYAVALSQSIKPFNPGHFFCDISSVAIRVITELEKGDNHAFPVDVPIIWSSCSTQSPLKSQPIGLEFMKAMSNHFWLDGSAEPHVEPQYQMNNKVRESQYGGGNICIRRLYNTAQFKHPEFPCVLNPAALAAIRTQVFKNTKVVENPPLTAENRIVMFSGHRDGHNYRHIENRDQITAILEEETGVEVTHQRSWNVPLVPLIQKMSQVSIFVGTFSGSNINQWFMPKGSCSIVVQSNMLVRFPHFSTIQRETVGIQTGISRINGGIVRWLFPKAMDHDQPKSFRIDPVLFRRYVRDCLGIGVNKNTSKKPVPDFLPKHWFYETRAKALYANYGPDPRFEVPPLVLPDFLGYDGGPDSREME